jgi:class 3 adenylate cyclase
MKGQTLQEWAGASRIFALVFTDIVDSTTLANELGDERWIGLLMKHFAQARQSMTKYDHHEIKIIGDSFMVVFRSVVDALDFALDFHSATGDERISIRAGIHVGPARIIEDDMYGMMVNYTKRVESEAKGRPWIMLSDEAKKHVDYEKATRHSSLDWRGPKNALLKGFAEPQEIWLVSRPWDKTLKALKNGAGLRPPPSYPGVKSP